MPTTYAVQVLLADLKRVPGVSSAYVDDTWKDGYHRVVIQLEPSEGWNDLGGWSEKTFDIRLRSNSGYTTVYNISNYAKIARAVTNVVRGSKLEFESSEGPKKVYEFQDQWSRDRREPRLGGYLTNQIIIDVYDREGVVRQAHTSLRPGRFARQHGSSMADLRTSLIRLAAVRADLRPHLLQILARGFTYNVGDIVRSRHRGRWVGVVTDRDARKDANPLYTLRIVLDQNLRPIQKSIRSQVTMIDETWLEPFIPTPEIKVIIDARSDPMTGWKDVPFCRDAGEHLPQSSDDWGLAKTERGSVAGRAFLGVLRVAFRAFDDVTREKANAWRAGRQRYRLEHDVEVIRAVNAVADAVQKQMDMYPDVLGETSANVLLDAIADHVALRFNLDPGDRRTFREALWVF